eukprot:253042-Chlamydomonas_euryale.AAC.1
MHRLGYAGGADRADGRVWCRCGESSVGRCSVWQVGVWKGTGGQPASGEVAAGAGGRAWWGRWPGDMLGEAPVGQLPALTHAPVTGVPNGQDLGCRV